MQNDLQSLRGVLCVAAALMAVVTVAEDPLPHGNETHRTLGVGDLAPPLRTGGWIQGEPVAKFAGGQVYLVEFWATWCGPCRVAIPRLNEIAARFHDKRLVVIGQNVYEEDDGDVGPFVESMGDTMTYRVALDDKRTSPDGAMAETWLEAAGRDGIPCSFLVDKEGRIAWIGHPMDLNDAVIEQVLAGTFDIAKAAMQEGEQAAGKATFKSRRDAHAEKAVNEANADGSRFIQISERLDDALAAGDWDHVERAVNDVLRTTFLADPTSMGLRCKFDVIRLFIMLRRGDPEAAAEWAVEDCDTRNEAPALAYAWLLTTGDQPSPRSLEIARRLADRVDNAEDGMSVPALVTLARIAFMRGDQPGAVELQRRAAARVGDKPSAQAVQATLMKYRNGQLPVETIAPVDLIGDESPNGSLRAILAVDEARAEALGKERDEQEWAQRMKKAESIMKLAARAQEFLQTEQWHAADRELDRIMELAPKMEPEFRFIRIWSLMGRGLHEQGFALAKQAAAEMQAGDLEDRCELNNLALALLTAAENVPREVLDFAHGLAIRANKGSLDGECRAEHLASLALAAFRKGDRDRAIELAQQALGLAHVPSQQARFRSLGEAFRAGTLP